ncbi:kinase-like domain-containing protein [Tricharina praecox]|uniref:kinase-like domain-containing protein n=1 Tax=Tricharina praecox TaxID=43433 RepID=UPI00221F546B|nr:kinase-like domain-containing protein [Tricharina praecox]KAI5843176.1 kinase-like domain-containing protein [Tricharina praecox]
MSTPSTATALAPLDIANPYSSYNYSHHHHLHHHHSNHNHNPHQLLHHHLQPLQIHNNNTHSTNPHAALTSLNSHSHHNHQRLPAPLPYFQPQSPLATAPVPSSASSPSSSVETRTTVSGTMASRTQAASTSSSAPRRSRRRTPDWQEFYRNGPPKEIIVIDDSPSPPPPAVSSRSGRQHQAIATAAAGTAALAPAPASSSSRQNGTVQYPIAATAASAAANNAPPRHADKKRKVQSTQSAQSVKYEPVYGSQPEGHAYSATQTPHLNGYASPTTLSAHSSASSVNGTTAGTSLGSVSSIKDYTASAAAAAASSNAAAAAAAVAANGQKRKRVTRASQAAAAAANTLDAFASYHPPPKPPIKAKDVYVQPIQDPDRNSQQRVDDNDGHYIVSPNTDLTARYRITKLLGQGTFGKVVEAYDRTKRTKCAIKVIRSVQKYRDASRIELRVLSTLSCNDKENRNKCIHLRDCFDYKNHICIVTDLLGMSVFDFLKGNQFAPFPSTHIQSFARQLFTSVAFLHDLNLIHTDLKPENILLRQGRTRRILLDTDIRLIDFGSATFDDEYHSSVVSTRHYRAPEIILGLGWSFPCDIWSIGCILVEFYTGDALFQTHDNLEHLAMMQAVCGPRIDAKLVRAIAGKSGGGNTSNASKYFKGARLDYPNAETTRASKKYVNAMKHLQDIIPSNNTFNKQFHDLLKKIFVYDPNKRITAKDALKHPWFRETIQDEGTEAAKSRDDREAEAARAQAYREAEPRENL